MSEQLPDTDLDTMVRQWVDSFPEAQVRSALSALIAQRDGIDRKIDRLETQIGYFESMRAKITPPTNGVVAKDPDPQLEPQRPKITPRRAAIIEILSGQPNRAFKLSEIKQRLVQRGLMEDTPRETHSLQVMAQKMLKKGELERPRDGYYRIRRDSGVEASAQTSLAASEDEGLERGLTPHSSGVSLSASEDAPGEAHLAGS